MIKEQASVRNFPRRAFRTTHIVRFRSPGIPMLNDNNTVTTVCAECQAALAPICVFAPVPDMFLCFLLFSFLSLCSCCLPRSEAMAPIPYPFGETPLDRRRLGHFFESAQIIRLGRIVGGHRLATKLCLTALHEGSAG